MTLKNLPKAHVIMAQGLSPQGGLCSLTNHHHLKKMINEWPLLCEDGQVHEKTQAVTVNCQCQKGKVRRPFTVG